MDAKPASAQTSNRSLPPCVRSLVNFCAVPRTTVSLLILLHLGITIPLAYKLAIWADEAFTLHTTGQDVIYAFNQSLYFELQPPVYFVFLNVWRDLNSSIFFARLFSVLCVALTIKVAASISQRLWRELHPGWVACVLAFHPFMIWAAMEIRVYALVMLLAAMLLLLFFDGYVVDADSRRARWLYLPVSVLALYTYYYLGFILVANALVLIFLRRWRVLFSYLASMFAAGLCFAPMTLIALRQVSTHTRPLNAPTPLWEAAKIISWRVKEYILPTEESFLLSYRSWIFRVVYASVAWFAARRVRQFLTTANIVIWTTAAITCLLFLAALRVTTEDMMLPRHTAVLFLPAILLAFSVMQLIRQREGVLIGVLLMLIFNTFSFSIAYKKLTQERTWDQVAEYLKANERPDQPILVFHAAAALPLAYYYSGSNALVPLPKENRFETFDIRDYVLRDEQEIFDAIARTPGEHDELWLVTDDVCSYLDVDYNCQLLEGAINKHFYVESSRIFAITKVRLLHRKPIH